MDLSCSRGFETSARFVIGLLSPGSGGIARPAAYRIYVRWLHNQVSRSWRETKAGTGAVGQPEGADPRDDPRTFRFTLSSSIRSSSRDFDYDYTPRKKGTGNELLCVYAYCDGILGSSGKVVYSKKGDLPSSFV